MLLLYLSAVNALAALLFFLDKRSAVAGGRRIPENVFHLLSLLGGALAILALMYLLRHKNRKIGFLLLTAVFAVLWIAALFATSGWWI